MWTCCSKKRGKFVDYDDALWVLMWKHLTERKRRLCSSLWEATSGVLVFGVLFLVTQTMQREGSRDTLLPNINISQIFYTPQTDFSHHLMTKVANKLNMDRHFHTPGPTIKGFKLKDDLYNYLRSMREPAAAVVVFEDNKTSKDLAYTIGQVARGKNELDSLLYGIIKMQWPEKMISSFLAELQWTIDSVYMEQLGDQKISHAIRLDEHHQFRSHPLHVINSFLILCTIVAPLPFFLYCSSRLIVERRSGLKELMKMMSVSPNTLRCSHLIDTAMVGIIYAILITVCLKVTSTPIIEHTNGVIILITIVLHFINTTSLAFITSALSQDFNHADSLAMLFYMCTCIVDFVWYTSAEHSRALLCVVGCFLPHAPVYIFWDEVITLELRGEGNKWDNMFKVNTKKGLPLVVVWLLSLVQLATIMALAWYIDLIRPGRYGIPEKWTFPCSHNFWSKRKKVTFHVTAEKTDKVLRDDRYFEKAPKRVEVAIKIVNVTKIFRTFGKPDVKALDTVSLDIYKGEITVLLGAHGAGKTTLLYIITGMYSSTKGTVYINGLDIANRIQELRKDFGLCPQNNVTFEYLTVRENIRFFEMLKSVGETQKSNATRLMRKLNLIEDADYFSRQLCAGKKRCLQVACALAGGSDVLVLDEPTSGMDPESRHSLWNMILDLRGCNTVLMSTACLEEADVLGDRIALLNNGRLRCHGTPLFLKDAIGAGFNLSVSFKHNTNVDEVVEFVESKIPLATSKMFENKRIIFKLPSKEHENFPQLFDYLEENKQELGIALIEVGMFMEEIFLAFIDQEKDYDLVVDSSLRNIHELSAEGFALMMQQLKALIVRTFIYMWRKKIQLIALQIVVPILSLITVTTTCNASLGYGVVYKLHLDGDMPLNLVYNTGPYRSSGVLDNLRDVDPNIRPFYSNNSYTGFNARTVGFSMAENISTIYYPMESQELVSKAVNMFSNVFLSVHYPYVVNRSIRTTYGDIEMRTTDRVVMPKLQFLCLEWALWIVFLSVLPLAPQVLLSIHEYMSGTRHNHYMAGCPPIVHWAAKLIAQAAVYFAVVPVTVLLVATLLEFDNTLNQFQFLGCVTAVLLVFGPAFLTHIYVLSFFLNMNQAMSMIYIMAVVFGILSPIFLYVLGKLRESFTGLTAPFGILVALAYCSPVYAFSVCLCRLTSLARLNAYCKLNKQLCPELHVDDFFFNEQKCCESSSSTPYSYLVSFDSGLYDLLLLIVHFFINSAIVVLVEMDKLPNVPRLIMNRMYKEPEQDYDEPTVKREREYVERKVMQRDFEHNALVAYNLHQRFFVSFKKRKSSRYCTPVRGVSFSAKYGECLCLLGPNGSGKRSTLLMLAGCLPMTRGEAYVEGIGILNQRTRYLHKIYLISTETGLDGFLSGHQNLVLMAKLQGYSDYTCNRLARQMLNFMGLQSFTDTNVGKFSVGCSRRLALCSTLIVGPTVALLDEPMTVVDPYTRPLVIRALKRLLNAESAVVVTETSLERHQMELIFDRVAIMFGGQIAAMGTPQQVNASLAMGYSVRIKLQLVIAYKIRKHKTYDLPPSLPEMASTVEGIESTYHSTDISNVSTMVINEETVEEEFVGPMRRRQTSMLYSEDVRDLKKDMSEIFPTSQLTNEHLSMLYYYIQDFEKQLQYSKLFTEMEGLKRKYEDLVEDYTLCAATVDEVYRNLKETKIVLQHRASASTK